ncbi:MAG: hypothetical protein OXU81_23670, partial [Gammaproteobacteria bacterium]|nr:hypothetical protein [Gammaproteobacteria bacterium]
RPRQRSVHCSARERRLVRARAKAAGKTISRYVLDLVRADAPSGGEAYALMERVCGIEKALRALRDPLPECEGLTLADAIALLARERSR